MYNWGEEIILESHRISWLIWIQLFVLFLLILLLSYFGLFSLDFAGPSTAVSSSPSKITSAGGEQEERGNQETRTETQTERTRGGESNTDSDGSSGKDLQRLLHPCYYLDFAKKAFLQCLGLGSAASSSRERANDD